MTFSGYALLACGALALGLLLNMLGVPAWIAAGAVGVAVGTVVAKVR